jgi:ribosomal protein S12 methylthiotransferase accessory factor YcaO
MSKEILLQRIESLKNLPQTTDNAYLISCVIEYLEDAVAEINLGDSYDKNNQWQLENQLVESRLAPIPF